MEPLSEGASAATRRSSSESVHLYQVCYSREKSGERGIGEGRGRREKRRTKETFLIASKDPNAVGFEPLGSPMCFMIAFTASVPNSPPPLPPPLAPAPGMIAYA